MYFDSTVLLLIPAMLFTIFAQAKVKSSYNKYKNIPSSKGYTGAQVAEAILSANGLSSVQIKSVSGQLSDHYNPSNHCVNLSQDIYSNSSIASIAVAAHECGHALQHAEKYPLLSFRSNIVPVVNLTSKAAWPLLMIGLILSAAANNSYGAIGTSLLTAGIIMFSFVVLFHLVTLPVEINASNRAIKQLEALNLIDENDRAGAKNMLIAAALTYLAALAVALMQLIRFILIANRRR